MKIAVYAGLCLVLTACGSGGGGEKNSNSTSSISKSSSLLSTSSESDLSDMSSSSLMSASSRMSSSRSSFSRSSLISASSISSSSQSSNSSTSSNSLASYDRAITREATFFGVTEQFNRYYTDPNWTPIKTVYVSPNGSGNGTSASSPTTPQAAINNAGPGYLIQFAAGEYNNACYNIDEDHSGTYDQPIVLKGSRDSQGNLATLINCCGSGRNSCINIELANYIALDSFELNGGDYGVRIVGEYATSGHVKGNAVLNSYGHDNSKDPFFTGGNDWFVIQGNKGERAGTEDGHGIYLSNGSDFNIVRYNELNDNSISDFQINADPHFICAGEDQLNIPFDDPECDGDAKDGKGAGVSEYMLVENNYFHNGRGQGPNFTSVRNSIVRNNIVAFYEKHGMTFWQETDNPNLGSSNNIIHHNLLIGTNDRELFQFHHHSDNNDVRNNIIIGINLSDATINSTTVVRATSDTSSNNTFIGNMYIGGKLILMDDDTDPIDDPINPDADEFKINTFDPDWFVDFPFDKLGSWESFKPTSSAPWVNQGLLDSESANDFNGEARDATPELGPWERPD